MAMSRFFCSIFFKSLLATIVALLSSPVLGQSAATWLTPYEKSEGKASATYEEAIDYYQRLATKFPEVKIRTHGLTDVGLPLHEVVIATQGHHDPERVAMTDKVVLMINNGIHAGESCGIDASMMLARDILFDPEKKKWLDQVVLVIIPVYNVGGSLNRGTPTRINQVGPEAYGFRGNARNLNLNRDFMKGDARNTWAFWEIFQAWSPELFVDTHTTDGADYQAPLTYLQTLADKAGTRTGPYMTDTLVPAVVKAAADRQTLLSPYVMSIGETPDEGLMGFFDSPRYSSGYASLFHCMAFISEAHMLKTFAERVEATRVFLETMTEYAWSHHHQIGRVIHEDRSETMAKKHYELNWTIDTSVVDTILFPGYEVEMRPGAVTGQPLPHYLRSKPYTKPVAWYGTYVPVAEVEAPSAYLISQASHEVIERLEANGVKVHSFKRDTTMVVETWRVTSFTNNRSLYEGHFFHPEVNLSLQKESISFRAGDAIVRVNQLSNNFLVHALEPEATDSYFRWNFFDSWLERKEYFDAYTFEEMAADLLKRDKDLQKAFEAKKSAEADFAANPNAQLFYLYEHSPYVEKTYRRLPVYRWEGNADLLLR